MKLIDAEYTFDNNKVLFYFTADGRIDFRELVKDLASVFKTRIELRQVGVRDETKINYLSPYIRTRPADSSRFPDTARLRPANKLGINPFACYEALSG